MFSLFRPRTENAPKPATFYQPMPEGRVVYAVGDIHGRQELLGRVHRAIDAADPRREEDVTEIYLGDYVDRGPDSRGVIDLLLERDSHHDHEIVCLRGNHEEMFSDFLLGHYAFKDWRTTGGLETLMSYGVDPRSLALAQNAAWVEAALREIPLTHLNFLADLRDSHRVGAYFFAHAGIRPGIALDDQTADDLLWIRDSFLGDRSDFGAIVVHGHTPTKDVEFRSNRINIDTGAYLTGRLTCLRIDSTGPRILPI